MYLYLRLKEKFLLGVPITTYIIYLSLLYIVSYYKYYYYIIFPRSWKGANEKRSPKPLDDFSVCIRKTCLCFYNRQPWQKLERVWYIFIVRTMFICILCIKYGIRINLRAIQPLTAAVRCHCYRPELSSLNHPLWIVPSEFLNVSYIYIRTTNTPFQRDVFPKQCCYCVVVYAAYTSQREN